MGHPSTNTTGKEANMNLIAMLMLAADPSGQPLPDVVLLDFHASYCPPCQVMAPIVQRMESDNYPIRKIDFGKQHATSRQYKVDAIPTFILLVEGREVKRFTGITAEQELRTAMLDAKKSLEAQRKTATAALPNTATAAEDTNPQPPQSDTPAPNAGLRSVIDRMKHSLAGAPVDRKDLERPDFRAQSPDEEKPTAVDDALAMQSTVRIRLDAGEFKDVGTGTIIHSVQGQSTILTCAHIFHAVDAADAKLEVEVFRDGKSLTYPATVLGGDKDADLAFLRIKNSAPLPMAPLQQGALALKPKQKVFSIGCSGGKAPTILNMDVKKIGYFNGPENILCTIDPVQGRSGGGLFNTNGELVGVCSGAFRESKEGLYTGVGAARKLMTRLDLNSLFECDVPGFVDKPKDGQTKTASFEKEVDSFEQMFEDSEAVFAEDNGAAEIPMPPPEFDTMPPAGHTDPFASIHPGDVAMASAPARGHPAEITVIIDDPVRGKQVVVVPQPSPWLLQLLTGEPNRTEALHTSLRQSPPRQPVPRSVSYPVYRTRSKRQRSASRPQLLPPVR